ncbi:hypothetical protein NP493_202g02019 [Ridgeia piscesae]|uniref:C2 domain-containing protein n=1 Tax=Ridgeia piscesae TaxID=27915 RepID=A0AAD9P1M1_RIDPI|nr:hypothetical protein NP493_202g02019 [Ridgeia piscesae]
MGSASLDPSTLHLDMPTQVRLDLSEKGQTGNMGYLLLQCTLMPRSQDDKNMLTTKVTEAAKKLRTHPRGSVVTVVLVRGTDLLPMDDNGLSDPYVKFRLGNEKYKSKYKPKTLNPVWLEQFNLHMFDDQTSHLEISVWDHDAAGKDDIMGRAIVNLSSLRREATHCLEQPLEDGAGSIKLLLTVSAVSGTDVLDMSTYTLTPLQRQSIVREYGLLNSFKDRHNMGWLQVKVIKAEGLASADIGGKSDPFCVLELDNARLQTRTEYKTLNPEWGKVFVMEVKDIHSVLEVTIFDEDRDRKAEFLGKVAIPLLRVRNMERRWFMLKDRKLLVRAKGAILLEMDLIYNPVKAFIRTFSPREEIYMQPEPKFRIALMKRNIERVSNIIQAVVETGRFLRSCFEWESPPRSITAFIVYLVMVWNFELYMLPVTLLIIFLKNLLLQQITGTLMKDKLHELDDAEEEDCDDDDDDDDDERDKEGKKSFKERLQGIQDVCLQVQEGMDSLASLGERVKNTFNWTVPWLTWLMVVLLAVVSIVLYWLPLRYLMLIWGINKFTKKLRAPNAISNNELLDFLSRVPSDVELVRFTLSLLYNLRSLLRMNYFQSSSSYGVFWLAHWVRLWMCFFFTTFVRGSGDLGGSQFQKFLSV